MRKWSCGNVQNFAQNSLSRREISADEAAVILPRATHNLKNIRNFPKLLFPADKPEFSVAFSQRERTYGKFFQLRERATGNTPEQTKPMTNTWNNRIVRRAISTVKSFARSSFSSSWAMICLIEAKLYPRTTYFRCQLRSSCCFTLPLLNSKYFKLSRR